MIELSAAVPSTPPAAPPPIAVADSKAASGSFGQTLGAFLRAQDAAPPEPVVSESIEERQDAAEGGKDLPVVTDEAQTPDVAAMPLWFTAAPQPTVAAIAPEPEIPQAVEFPAVAPDVTVTPPPAEPTDIPVTKPIDPVSPSPKPFKPVVEETPEVVSKPPVSRPIVMKFDITVPNTAPPPVQPENVTPAIAVSAIPQPAAQLFASARALAGSWREREPRGEAFDATLSLTTSTPIELRERAIVQALSDTANAALDLTADTGLQRMIDRIETLRDSANAGDTRVRLIPDALGSIDVAVRQEGARVHVRFTAEHEATRALIAEAQPRLTELAAARGVRIGETSVSTGSGGSNGSAPQPRATPPRAPAAAAAARESDFSTDHRLA